MSVSGPISMVDIEAAKKEFGLIEDKTDQSLETDEMELGIKDEFIDSQGQGLIEVWEEK